MQLKKYQQDVLNVLQSFFEQSRIVGHKDAYKIITTRPENQVRLGKLNYNYIQWDSLPNTPRVCLKVPTGGGKTIIASHSLRIVADVWMEKEYPVVLWFVPSETIRRQTSEALKNCRHPYREVLDEQFNGRVRIFDIDEKFNIRPQDISENLCVIVSTIQSFNKKDTDRYNVYKHNENLEPHFTNIVSVEGMEKDAESQKLKFSFANLMYYHRPIMIVDEAHNNLTDLSEETQTRINPSAIIELTATPRLDNNTLYNVKALELKEEEMIKLPIFLKTETDWEAILSEAIVKRSELEKLSEKEDEYIRPLILFQAQNKDQEYNVEFLKKYLIETSNIPEEEIAIATGDQKELDGVNVFDKKCLVKYIITVEALKEGWDCSFAYILCSLANVRSNVAVEQLLGRVMRMPYAKKRKDPALNKAYAYVVSQSFEDVATALVEKLIAKGFESEEIEVAFEPQTFFPLYGEIAIETKIKQDDIPSTIELRKNADGSQKVVLTEKTTEEDVEKLCAKLKESEAFFVKQTFYNTKKTRVSTPSFASNGETFIAPTLKVEIQGNLELAEPETIFGNYDWSLLDHPVRLNADEFKIEKQGQGYSIDIDGRGLRFSYVGEEEYLPNIDVKGWSEAVLVSWLDRKLKQIDIPQVHMIKWLSDAVDYLIKERELSLPVLMVVKYALATKLKDRIARVRTEENKKAYQMALFDQKSRVEIDFNKGFLFKAGMFDDQPFYRGTYKFQKHFFGDEKIPQLSNKGEEFDFAKVLDNISEVKYWIRNPSKHPNSFWLPTSTDKFYPDFVAVLNDGRVFVIEYKGDYLVSSDDTREKERIGQLWEKQSKNKTLFLIVEKTKNGMTMEEQIKNKIA